MTKNGFTLIELLVAITIIAILTSVAVMVYGQGRAQARDARRVEDLQKVAVALEAYYNENRSYPSTSEAWWGACSSYGGKGFSGSNGWVPNLAPTYLNLLPNDPKNDGVGQCYLYRSNGQDYMLLIHFTMETVCDGTDADTTKDPGDECNSQTIQQLDRPCCEQPTIAIYSSETSRLW